MASMFISTQHVLQEIQSKNGWFAVMHHYMCSHNTFELMLYSDKQSTIKIVCDACTYIQGPTEWTIDNLEVECLHGPFRQERYVEILDSAGNGPVFCLRDANSDFKVYCADVKIMPT